MKKESVIINHKVEKIIEKSPRTKVVNAKFVIQPHFCRRLSVGLQFAFLMHDVGNQTNFVFLQGYYREFFDGFFEKLKL